MKKNIVIIGIVLVLLTFVFHNSVKSEQSNPITSKESDLSVIFVGTGTPQYSQTQANSCTAIKYNDTYYIIDCGDGSNTNIQESEIEFKNIGGVFFTHHHIDHTTDFFDIYVKCILSGSEKINIVGPPRTNKFVEFVNEVYLDDILYRVLNVTKNTNNINKDKLIDFAMVKEVIGEDEIKIGDLTITTAEMSHSMYNLAYKFEANGRSIVVSGDTSYDEDLIKLSKGADILVIDGALYKESSAKKTKEKEYIAPFYEYGGNFEVSPHMTFEDMVKIAAEANVKKLVITHYNYSKASQKRIETSIAKIKESFSGEVFYATDMLEVHVKDSDTEKNK